MNVKIFSSLRIKKGDLFSIRSSMTGGTNDLVRFVEQNIAGVVVHIGGKLNRLAIPWSSISEVKVLPSTTYA